VETFQDPKRKCFSFGTKKKRETNQSHLQIRTKEREKYLPTEFMELFSIESDPSEFSHPLPEIQDSNFQQVKSREMDNKFPPD